MQVIRSIEELDARMEACDRAEAVSEEALRAALAGFRMDPPVGLPPDPFSEEYREAQLALCRDIAGHDLVAAEPGLPRSLLPEGSAAAGERLMALGWLIRAMAPPRGARIVQFGAGQGDAAVRRILADLDGRVRELLSDLVPDLALPPSVLER